MKRPDRYATLLRVRKRVEELKANALASAQRDELAARDTLAGVELAQRDALGRASDIASGTDGLRRVSDLIDYERHLGRVALNQGTEIEKLANEAEVHRNELQEAVMQRRMVDRLMERAREAFQHWLNIQDQRLTDETATIRAARAAKQTTKPIGRTV